MELASLSPAQHRVVVDLMALGQPRPRFDPDLAGALRRSLEEALDPLVGESDGQLWVDKRRLGHVHACEAHYLAEEEEGFSWTPRTAQGTVVHRAIELGLWAPGPPPAPVLVDHAIQALAGDDRRGSAGSWLAHASDLELAELRGRANDAVVKFFECWPPLPPSWSPRTETAIGAQLCGRRVLLRGKVDLALGQPRGADGEARGLIVDLKTGLGYGAHLDDLRFYALVQTLRVGVPPFRVASYYLDTGTFHAEDVTVETLELAVRRTVDGARKLADLAAHRRPPTRTPGPTCRWCRLRATCPEARNAEDEGLLPLDALA